MRASYPPACITKSATFGQGEKGPNVQRRRRRMKSVAPIPMPPNSGRSAVRMMRSWADEFDRLREYGRVIKMGA